MEGNVKRLVVLAGDLGLKVSSRRRAMFTSVDVERIAEAFHEAYEEVAPEFAYVTRTESAVPWDQVPEANRRTMLATVHKLLDDGVIAVGSTP